MVDTFRNGRILLAGGESKPRDTITFTSIHVHVQMLRTYTAQRVVKGSTLVS